MKPKKTLRQTQGKQHMPSVSRAQIEHVLKKYSREHHVSAQEMYSIMSEFVKGFEFLRKYKKAVSIYGSSRLGFHSNIYKQACILSCRLAKDGFTIITGGGPGIMEAANKGAYEANGKSVGINIKLKRRQMANKYVTESKAFGHFYIRKTMLSFASKIYIFFPGGFGTLDELFEMIMLVQTEKLPRTPIILVDKNYWTPLTKWIEAYLFKKNHAVDKKDLQIYYLVDSANEAYQLIKKLIKAKNVPL